MGQVIVFHGNEILLKFTPAQRVTTVGDSGNFDYTISDFPGEGMTIVKEKDSVQFFCLGVKEKNLEGAWNRDLKADSILKIHQFQVVYISEENKMVDFDFSKLPQDPKKKNYPDKLLNFIIEIVGGDRGALLLRRAGLVQILSSVNLKIKNRAEFVLNSFLDRPKNAETTVVKMSFDTHTMLFEAGLSTFNFLLVRSKISDDDEVVLYLPENENKELLPEGTLKTILHLAAQGLGAHLLYESLSKMKEQQKKVVKGEFFWGSCENMGRLQRLTDKLAKTDLSLFIEGETGAGKEMLAEYISKVSGIGKITSVNCAAIPAQLAESYLFGHKRGSFTGADRDQVGKIQQAHGGILFLDEIGDLPLDIQAKLLRVLQDGIVQPVGGGETKVKVRLICATHKNLRKKIDQGEFREDLYYRISEATLTLPSLKDRGEEDIMALASYFLHQAKLAHPTIAEGFSPSAEEFLKNNIWTGNVRELSAIVKKAAILSNSKLITREDFSLCSGSSEKSSENYPLNLNTAKKVFVKRQIERALIKSQGNKTKAAKMLGITGRSLFRLISDYEEEKVTNYDKSVMDFEERP